MSATLYGADFFAGRGETVTRSAWVVAPQVAMLLQPKSILDVGCGQGEWLEVFSLWADDWYGVDIAAPGGDRYIRQDLTEPLRLGREFDLVISLETAEHLPVEAEDVYLDSLVRHGDTILFSAAVPGQEGVGHINCQPHQHWHDQLAERGYRMQDSIRPRIQGDGRVSPWYRDNIFLYVKED